MESVFNYPVPGRPDLSLTTTLVDLIDQTPIGEQIRVSYFVVQPVHPVLDALLRAYNRGVSVRVVLDSGDGQLAKKNDQIDVSYARLAEQLGSNRSADSFAIQCEHSCVTDEKFTINHNKFAAFSRTGASDNVVFQSTGNLRADGSGDSAYNAAVVLRGNIPVYQQFVGYFQDLSEQIRVPNDDYAGFRPPVASGPVTAHFFPRNDGQDTVSAALRTINCTAQPTRVRVMASYFSREKVRDALRDMAYAGCTIQVLARQDNIARDFCDRLDPRKVLIKIAPSPKRDRVTIHAKYIVVNGSYGGRTGQAVTWMGSHNFTDNALERNDETFLKITDAQVNRDFRANFDRLWRSPAMSAGCARAGAKDGAAVEKGGDTEVTKIARRAQSLKRRLPRNLRKRQALRPVKTAQGKRLKVAVQCKRPGAKRWRKQSRCRVIRRKGVAVLLLDSRRSLRVRVIQTAKGNKRLLPFKRITTYRYSPKKSRAVRVNS